MVPVLSKLLVNADSHPLQETRDLRVWGSGQGIADNAMRRLLELSPQEAARVLRADIANGSPLLAGFAVREFQAQDIPEADETFSRLLKTSPSEVLPLVEKFGTSNLSAQMLDLYKERSWSCSAEESFVTYFARTSFGEDSLAREILRGVMANRERRGCYRMLLDRIASVVWNDAIEAQAIESLNDADPEVVTSAARVLSAHGTARVEKFLWQRLERWSERWRGRASELETHPITGIARNTESGWAWGLFVAISSARSWVLDESRRRRLSSLCIESGCREAWSQVRSGPLLIEVYSGGGMYPAHFKVNGYKAPTLDGLKKKLLQYPAGSAFRWCARPDDSSDWFSPGQRREMLVDLESLLTARSMSIESKPLEECFSEQ
jgi:hypothetical protein